MALQLVNVTGISVLILMGLVVGDDGIPTTLEGPFKPVTVPLDRRFRGRAGPVDLPNNDPMLQRTAEGFEPEQIAVALSTAHDSVWISWITGESQIGDSIKPLNPATVDSVVHYGMLPFLLIHEAKGHSLIYNQLYPFEGLRNYTSGIIHHVRLTGLQPNTNYYYRCGDPTLPAMSDIYQFRTMPKPCSISYPSKIAVAGDLGLTFNATSTISHLMRNKPDLIILPGDICYANLYLTNGSGSNCYSRSFRHTPIHETYQPRWDYLGSSSVTYARPLVSSVPLVVIEGSHEVERQAGNVEFAAYNSRFAFPSEESGSRSPFYYSFNAGGIHFLMLGGYTALPNHSITHWIGFTSHFTLFGTCFSANQYRWLERDLANVNREVTPWLVAVWNQPWYSTYKAHYKRAECMRVAMEELLYNYGVDIVFNGHVKRSAINEDEIQPDVIPQLHDIACAFDSTNIAYLIDLTNVHAYERSNRVYNYTLDPCGPVHITVGNGGNREKMAIKHADDPGNCPHPSTARDNYMGGLCAHNFTSGQAAGKFCWDQQPEYSAYRETSFGHGILEVKSKTHALWTWYRNQDMDKAGDQIYIVRQPDRCPVQPNGH
ncbi:hypothetical protein RJ639_015530 [Escallonia herrerae]|uniref:Purple acid phosphatase n=1 Tax=Escallonia herrerae TaxID=1293975 RepID=A0AA88VDV7_9ASTE|nr:hypothetical protein RJ639_015530 [Escallonia herrerae]